VRLVPLFLFALLFGASVLSSPAPRVAEADTLLAPPAEPVVRIASLGRHAAAGDLAWLRAVQFVGAPQSEELRYAGLELWIALINDLAPDFDMPYYVGGMLLATSPGRERVALEILERAERELVPEVCRQSPCPAPDTGSRATAEATCKKCEALAEMKCDWEVPMWHGFVSYFGQMDTKTAARSLCTSVQRGGPPYLSAVTARFAEDVQTCQGLRRTLGQVARQQKDSGERGLLSDTDAQLRVLIHCEERAIKHAEHAYRVRFGKPADTLQELVNAELLSPPFSPLKGQCWTLRDRKGKLVPCADL
jgi:hypothetical protein